MEKNLNWSYIAAGAVMLLTVWVAIGGVLGNSYNVTGNAINGACIDSEVGRDRGIYGIVKVNHRTGTDVYNDKCLDDSTLMEYFCASPSKQGSDTINCPNGCRNGYCVK